MYPAEVEPELWAKLEDMAKRAFRALRCEDYARMDFRLDGEGEPKILELNSLPGLQPGYSDFPMVVEGGGYSYTELIERLVKLATERHAKKK